MNNISCFDVAPIPKISYPMWAFVGAFIGFCILFLKNPVIILIGLMVMCVCISEIGKIYQQNQALGDYLILSLNSGVTLYLTCDSKMFLYEVENTITECFKDSDLKVSVNLKDCSIDYWEEGSMNFNNTGNYVKGNNNTVSNNNSGGINENSSINDADWEKLANLFPRATSQVACLNPTKGWIGHLATAARVKYPAALQRCKFDTPLLAAGPLI